MAPQTAKTHTAAANPDIVEDYGLDHTPSLQAEEDTNNDDSLDSNNFAPSLFFGSIANLCSATLGAGVLSLPYALYQSGLVFGLGLLGIAAWSSIVSIRFLVEASSHFRIYTYEGLVDHVLGRKAKLVTQICMIIFCVGCAVAYVIAVGDILEPVILELFPKTALSTHMVLIIIWSTTMLPLSLFRRMESLQWTSGIGVFSIGLLMTSVVIHFWQDRYNSAHEVAISSLWWPASPQGVLLACPIVLFGFACQVNVCPIYYELGLATLTSSMEEASNNNNRADDDSKPKFLMHRVTVASVTMCAFLYSVISTSAFLDFGSTLGPNVLMNYQSEKSIMMTVASVGMALAVIVAFPLNVFPARVTLANILFCEENDGNNDDENFIEPLLSETSASREQGHTNGHYDAVKNCHSGNGDTESNIETMEPTTITADPPENTTLFQHVILTLGIAGAALGLALLIPNISVVFGLLGGTTSSIFGFILPGLLGRTLSSSKLQTCEAYILIIGGTVIGIVTTTVTIYNTFFD
mmetsp:Transcript_22981/g.34855  ORF Transcript_22981/g.34855 Transcript_22981/m.34855 type:complete len:523 (+) Transcript_22981:65-1633(+)